MRQRRGARRDIGEPGDEISQLVAPVEAVGESDSLHSGTFDLAEVEQVVRAVARPDFPCGGWKRLHPSTWGRPGRGAGTLLAECVLLAVTIFPGLDLWDEAAHYVERIEKTLCAAGMTLGRSAPCALDIAFVDIDPDQKRIAALFLEGPAEASGAFADDDGLFRTRAERTLRSVFADCSSWPVRIEQGRGWHEAVSEPGNLLFRCRQSALDGDTAVYSDAVPRADLDRSLS